MDKIKRYIDCIITTETCNFKCHYCYIGYLGKFKNKLMQLSHSPQEIRKALSKERLGGVCLLNMCAGGETLLSPDVIPVVAELLKEGHYVMIVTNGSATKRFEEIRDSFSDDMKSRLFFKFSFHYLELLRLNIMDKFFNNVKMMRDSGCSITVELTPNDEVIPMIEDIKKVCFEKIGALPHITIARDDRTNGINHLSKLSFEDYKKTWSVFNSKLFDFKKTIFYQKRKEFCYAGDYVAYLNLTTGNLYPCHGSHKKISNVYTDEKIKFKAIGKCPIAHCYNGHSWLVFGAIPELQTPTYADIRDRVDSDGNHWLKESVFTLFSTKTSANNDRYSESVKKKIYIKNSVVLPIRGIKRIIGKGLRKLKCLKK